jgi:hypothetical protein
MGQLPAYVSAQLKVAAKIKNERLRRREIDAIIHTAGLHHPECFAERQGCVPVPRVLSTFEKYVETLKVNTKSYIVYKN